MKTFQRISGMVLVIAGALFFQSGPGSAAGGAWIERSEVFHYSGQKPGEPFDIRRHRISIWNGEGRQDLEFSWEPEVAPGLDDQGKISGRGELTWRPEGVPDYDNEQRYSIYTGDLLGGKRHGNGEYRRRDGLVYDGEWKDDLFDGKGKLTSPNGDIYEGTFHAGRFDGYGKQTLHSGEVYMGTFRNGQRDGEARILTTDGLTLATRWANGKQILVKTVTSSRAGLSDGIWLVAEQAKGQAAKVEVGISINQEMNQKFGNSGGVDYSHQVLEDRIEIYPTKDAYSAHWRGSAAADTYHSEKANSIFLNLSLAGKDGFKFGLKKLVFDVEESSPFNKPMLDVGSNSGCVDFRPDFHFKNFGWGAVEKASIEFVFGNEDGSKKSDRLFTVQMADFDKAADVVIRDAVAAMGANVSALDKPSMPVCPTYDQAESCLASAIPALPTGQLAPFVFKNWHDAAVMVFGKINYQWTDHTGAKRAVSEPFSTAITLASLEFEQTVAECSDLPFMLPEVPRLFKVELPSAKKDYEMSFDVNLAPDSRVGGVLDVSSDRSSKHVLRVGGEFSDGSKKMSKPLNVFFYKPRQFTYEDHDLVNKVKLPMCHLKESGSC